MSLQSAEYEALRRTIAARGTVRVVLLPVVVSVWAALASGLLVFTDIPAAALFSLAILAAGFEAIHALHVGVVRIGRYLQVFYEADASGPRWETTAMAVGPALPGGGIDPLFTAVFGGTALLNLLPAFVVEPTAFEVGILGAVHLAFVVRIIRARGAAARQRAVELESFRALRAPAPELKP